MKVSEELSEVLGMFAADGCLQKQYICIWGNINEDKNYYNKIVCPLFSRIFKKNITAHEKKSNSVYGFYLCDKKIVEFFRKIGFSNKKTYNVRVPKIILNSNNSKIYAAFIRGFVDCDGCLVFQRRIGKYKLFKRKFHTYPKIEIKIISKQMIEDLSCMLNKLGIKHTKHITKSKKVNEKQVYSMVVRGPSRIQSWIDKIGFNNPVQYSKYLIWKKFGFCPIRTSLKQRELILDGKLNPYLIYKSGPDRI